MVLDAGGNTYGTTSGYCNGGYGTIFSISADQSETVIYGFAEANAGAAPTSIALARDGTIYGVTSFGGEGYGTVFSLAQQSGS